MARVMFGTNGEAKIFLVVRMTNSAGCAAQAIQIYRTDSR
jgi:hypothetical protein